MTQKFEAIKNWIKRHSMLIIWIIVVSFFVIVFLFTSIFSKAPSESGIFGRQVIYQKVTLNELQGPSQIKRLSLVKTQGTIIDIKTDPKNNKIKLIVIKDAGEFGIIAGTLYQTKTLAIGDKVNVQGAYEGDGKYSDEFSFLPDSAPFVSAYGDISVVAPLIQPKSIPVKSITYNWPNFSKIDFADYVKNPPAYLNSQIKITSGMVLDFLAAGDRGGDTNLIIISDPKNPLTLDLIGLRIDSSSYYQKATSALTKQSDLIVVYGIGAISQESTSGKLLPVVKVLRLDKCDLTVDVLCSDGFTQTLFP